MREILFLVYLSGRTAPTAVFATSLSDLDQKLKHKTNWDMGDMHRIEIVVAVVGREVEGKGMSPP